MIKLLSERADFHPDANAILNIFGQMGPNAAEALPAVRAILEKNTGVNITRMIASNVWTQIDPGSTVPSIVVR